MGRECPALWPKRLPQKVPQTLRHSPAALTSQQSFAPASLRRKACAAIAMVTTRRQSKDFEPVELPPVAHRKRKRSNDAVPAPSTAQPPSQSSAKRRKKVKSTAKVGTPAVPVDLAPAASSLSSSSTIAQKPLHAKATDRNARTKRAQRKLAVQPKLDGLGQTVKLAEANLRNGSDSSDDEPAPQSRRSASKPADDEDADSRYTLGPRRKRKSRKLPSFTAQRTAELKFEEDGLEEIDKAKVAVAVASSRTRYKNKAPDPVPRESLSDIKVDGTALGVIPEARRQTKDQAKAAKVTPPAGVPSRAVMFTISEAVQALSLYRNGTMSAPTAIDPQSRQPYEPLRTGEFLAYPVNGTYHLGSLGRYGIDTTHSLPFALTIPLLEHSFIKGSYDTSTAETSRHGLGFSSAAPPRPQGPAVRRPNNYCFTFGKYRGRRMDSVPISYLRSIYNSDEYHKDTKLQQAFVDLYPKGLYESEAESYTFEIGGFKGKRFDEVPKSYLWSLLRKKSKNELVGGQNGRGQLERALDVWEKEQLDLTKD